MKVIRKTTVRTNGVCVGDQITVNLKDFGKFTATAQRVTDDSILFLFDEVIAERPMNEQDTNKGGFEKSDLNRWLHDTVLPAFPKGLLRKVQDITLPTYGEIFGHDHEADFYYKSFVPDEDMQFESMKRRGNRVCDFNGDWCWWWLRNATRVVSSTYFAFVGTYGFAHYLTASSSLGVRPEFWLVR